MRVGVIIPGSAETEGGGHVIERDLLDALVAAMPRASHEFVLFGGTETSERPLPANARYCPLYPRDALPSRLKRRASRVAKSARDLATNPAALGGALAPATPPWVLERERIEFLVHLQPFVAALDIPFLMFVWDVEHRVQPYFPELSAGGEWERRERLYTTTLPRAAVVVTGTRDGRDQLERLYDVAPERIALIPHPTPSDALALAEELRRPPTSQRASDTPFLLYPAQFWPHKNHVGLLAALRILADRNDLRPKLVLVGADKGNRAHVERVARDLGLSAQVSFPGFIARRELLRLYTQAGALVYPTTFGPENLPPLEAFALDCPVVASNVPGADEQLGDAALLVDPHDHAALAEAIRRVLTDEPLRGTLIERGRERATRTTAASAADALLACVDRFAPVRRLWP